MKKIFLLLALSLFPVLLSSTAFKMQKASASEDKEIYIDVSSNQLFQDSTNLSLHYFDNDNHYLPLLNDNDTYKVVIPYEVVSNPNYGFEITCLENKTTWINGDNLLKNDFCNHIAISDVVKEGVYEISFIINQEKRTNPGATYLTQRVWLHDNVNSLEHVICYYSENNWNFVIMKYYDLIGTSLYYVDIPYQLTSIHFLVMDQNTINQDYNIDLLTYGICYSINDNNEIETSIVNGANALLLSYVVEAYLTYGKDPSNGCTRNTIKNVFYTWFKNKSATSNELKSTKISDYVGYKDGSYEQATKTGIYSVNEKWNTMCSQVGIDPKTGEDRSFFLQFEDFSKKGIILIGGTFGIMFVVIVGYMVVKNKKRT